jgi:DNA-binding response OmpR family regulator
MTFRGRGAADQRLVHPNAMAVWDETAGTVHGRATGGGAAVSSSQGSPRPAIVQPREPLRLSVKSEMLSLIVSTRECSTIGVIPPLLEHGFTSVERPLNEALTFLGLLKPGLVIAFIDPQVESDYALIEKLISFGPRVLAVTPTTEGQAAVLTAGADACICDGDSQEKISALILAIRRRMPSEDPRRQTSDVGGLQLDHRSRQVRRGAATIRLTPMEFSILERLLDNSGRVISSVELQLGASGQLHSEVEAARTVKVYVRRLRSKLAPLGVEPEFIANIRGHGYLIDRAL